MPFLEGGEYLGELSSLVLMTSLERISESGRKEDMVQKWRGKEVESPEGSSQTWQTFLQLRRSVPGLIFLSILATK